MEVPIGRQELREKIAGELGKFAEANGLKTVKTQALLDSEDELDHLIDEYEAKQLKEWQEVADRLKYFFMRIDGSYEFPNSADGDILKMVHKIIQEQRRRAGIGEK